MKIDTRLPNPAPATATGLAGASTYDLNLIRTVDKRVALLALAVLGVVVLTYKLLTRERVHLPGPAEVEKWMLSETAEKLKETKVFQEGKEVIVVPKSLLPILENEKIAWELKVSKDDSPRTGIGIYFWFELSNSLKTTNPQQCAARIVKACDPETWKAAWSVFQLPGKPIDANYRIQVTLGDDDDTLTIINTISFGNLSITRTISFFDGTFRKGKEQIAPLIRVIHQHEHCPERPTDDEDI